MFLKLHLQNSNDADKMWFTVARINLLQNDVNVFHLNLNNGSTLPCETWNAHCARAIIEVLPKETSEFIPLQLWPSSLPDLNPLDSMSEIWQEKVYETHITDLHCSYRWRHWQMAAAMTVWSNLAHSVFSRCFSSSRSPMHIFTPSLAIVLTCC